MAFNNKSSYSIIPLFLLLFIFSVAFLHPSVFENSYAIGTDSTTTLTLEPSLSAPVVDPSSVVLALTPEADSSFVHSTASVDVSTNNGTGYTLSISTVGSDNNLNLGGATGASSNIGALSSETTLSTFSSSSDTTTLNKWGFTTDNNGSDPSSGEIVLDHYLAVPNNANSRVIKVTDDAANTSTTNVTLATKVNRDLPAGAYNNTIIFTATANTNPDVFMQDFSAEECNALDEWSYDSATGTVHEGDTITLYDRRDNNSYKVRKLADHNCWMTQNLRLSGDSLSAHGHSTTLDDSDTDLAAGTTFTLPNSAAWTDRSIAGNHLVNAGDPTAVIGTEHDPAVTEPLATQRGTYYTWPTATADTSSTGTSVTKTTSICPKGWKLPTGAGTTAGGATTTNQFSTLLYAFYDSDKTRFDTTLHYYASAVNVPDAIYAGYWLPSGYVGYSSTGGSWWSSTSHSSNTNSAFTLDEDTSNGIYPANGSGRYIGFSIRCVLTSS